MSELGKTLREAREAKQLSYQDLAKPTKIRENVLMALEAEEYTLLPAPVYVRGLLRTLARHLGLNGDQLVKMYEAAEPRARILPKADLASQAKISTTIRKPAGLLPPPSSMTRASRTSSRNGKPEAVATQPVLPTQAKDVRRLELRPSVPKFTPTRQRLPQLPQIKLQSSWVIAGLMLVLFTICGAYSSTQWLPILTPQQTAPAVAPVAPTQTDAAPLTTLQTSPTPEPTPAPTIVPTPTPTPAPTSAPSTATASFTIKIEISERSWLLVEVDGKSAFEGTLDVGVTKTFTARSKITLRAGNAGGVKVQVGNQASAVLGQSGQVVDRQWILTSQGAVEPAAPIWVTPPDALLPTPTPTPSA